MGRRQVYSKVSNAEARRLLKAYYRGQGLPVSLAAVTMRAEDELYLSPYLLRRPLLVDLKELNERAREVLG